MTKLFVDKARYLTRGIDQELPVELQSFLWICIEQLINQGVEPDYLQVFELNSRKIEEECYLVTVKHSQEVPEYCTEYLVNSKQKVSGKIFVIDDGAYATMLWSSEY